jgi:hypothetical protein
MEEVVGGRLVQPVAARRVDGVGVCWSGAGQSTRIRAMASRSFSSFTSKPAMIVLPAPGSSARRKRRRDCGSLFR